MEDDKFQIQQDRVNGDELPTVHIWETHREVIFGKEVVRFASDSILGNAAIGAAAMLRPREAFAIARDAIRSIRG